MTTATHGAGRMRPSVRTVAAPALALALTASLAACGSSDSASASSDELRFAVTDVTGMEELQREYGAFEKAFEDASGMDLQFYAVNDRTAAAAALDNGHVDVVFTGPAEYIVIHERTGAVPIVAIRRVGYRSCLYTTPDSGMTQVSDLKGAKVAMSDIGSTSGHLGPSQILVDAGLTPREDVEVLTVGDAVHEALVRGDVDAVGIGCHDYEEFTADEADAATAFPLLEEGDLLPPDLMMAREDLDPKTVDKVRTAFEDNWPALLSAMLDGKDNAKYEGAELVSVEDGDYDVVRSMYRAIGVDDFTEFVGD